MKHKIEAAFATVATSTSWFVDANHLLQFAISLLTLGWWIRLWITNKKDPKP